MALGHSVTVMLLCALDCLDQKSREAAEQPTGCGSSRERCRVGEKGCQSMCEPLSNCRYSW